MGDPLRLLRASRLHTRTPPLPIVGPAPRPAWVPTLWVPLVWGPPTHPPVPCWHSALWWQVEPQRRGSPKTSRPISVIGDSPGTRPGEVTLASWGCSPATRLPPGTSGRQKREPKRWQRETRPARHGGVRWRTGPRDRSAGSPSKPERRRRGFPLRAVGKERSPADALLWARRQPPYTSVFRNRKVRNRVVLSHGVGGDLPGQREETHTWLLGPTQWL